VLDKDAIEQIKTQDQLLAICLFNGVARQYLEQFDDDMFSNSDQVEVLNHLKSKPEYRLSSSTFKELNKVEDYVKMLMLQFETLYQNLSKSELVLEAKRLRDRLITRYVKKQKALLSEEMQNADSKKTLELLNKAKKLDQLLKQIGE
jgi:hypothetical protein